MVDLGTVLIVEDDDGIRSLLVAVVERDGFRSRVAEDGDGALEALGDGAAEPVVILLDLISHLFARIALYYFLIWMISK